MGRDAKYVCQKPTPKAEQPTTVTLQSSLSNDAASSDDDDDEEELGTSQNSGSKSTEQPAPTAADSSV